MDIPSYNMRKVKLNNQKEWAMQKESEIIRLIQKLFQGLDEKK